MTKLCPKCTQTKPAKAFYKNKSRPDGLATWCKACADRDNRKRMSKYGTKYNAPSYKRRAKKQWAYSLGRKFGLTEDDYDALLNWSKGGCAICGERAGPGDRRLDVDHDHRTGKIRGLLCRACNTGIGKLQEDARILRIAIAYLEYFDG